MIREIVKHGDPRLQAANVPITDFGEELRTLVRDLIETCHAAPGLGLAAPQVGVNQRVAIVDLSVGKDQGAVLVLVNPIVLASEGEVREEEGCLSIPGISEKLSRPARVAVEAADETGHRRQIEGQALLARALCHEIDHLDSRLFVERLRGLKKDLVMKKLARRARFTG